MNLNFIFDLDGTLIDTRNLVLKSINDVFVNGGVKNFIYANFDPLNTLILRGKYGIT